MEQFLFGLATTSAKIDHLCISTHKHPFYPESYPSKLKDNLETENIFVDTTINPLHALKNLFSGKSYNISRFYTEAMDEAIKKKLVQNNYSHVILESLFTTPYVSIIRQFSKAKILVRTHNVEFDIWAQLASNTANPFKKWYLRTLATQLKKYEIESLCRVDRLLPISEVDANRFDELGINTSKVVIPVSIELSETPVDYKVSDFFFLGSMNWNPNREAVELLTRSIFPKISSASPTSKLHLAGSHMEEFSLTSTPPLIINHGFVDSSQTFMASHGILLLPINSGSGVRIKLLEAMGIGVPVITTPQGAEGIDHKDTLIIARTEDEFVEKAVELRNSEEKRKALGEKARIFIIENYSFERIAQTIRDVIN